MRKRRQIGMTLIEVTIAITLVGLLIAGMLWSMRVGLNTLGKTNDRMMANRKVTGAQRVLEAEFAGMMPVNAQQQTEGGAPGLRTRFFQGEGQSMRFVTSYSLREASRGVPRIVELHVVPGGESGGVRLIVNEWPYTGPFSAGVFITGQVPGGDYGVLTTFKPIEVGPGSFVLADKMASCRFFYQEPRPQPEYQRWLEVWSAPFWPSAIRVELVPLNAEPGQLRMVSLTAPVRITKSTQENYIDQ